MEHIVIGIEGLVGAGKTSISRELLNKIPNCIILHGGNLYRGIVYALMKLKRESNIENLESNLHNIDIKQLMDKLQVKIEIEDRESVVYVGKEKIDENELQSPDNSLAVSIAGKTADNTKLYMFARKLIDTYKQKFNVIVSGRDLIKIYPDLNYHFLITASIDERVRRKCIQYNEAEKIEKIRQNIIMRDKLQEEAGFYKKYKNTIEIDVTNCRDANEGADIILSYINEI